MIPVAFPQEGSHALQTLWTQRQQLLLKDGILYRKWEDVPGRGRHQHLQLILPQELVPTVLDALHNHPTAGHLGVTKILQKVRSRFYCHAPLQLHQPGVPLQRVAMDILGPLPETERGNRYILVITDYFTKWTEAFPMSNMEAHTVAKLFVYNFVCRFGAPDYLHTDEGRNFESNLFSEICKLLGVSKTRTTPYHP